MTCVHGVPCEKGNDRISYNFSMHFCWYAGSEAPQSHNIINIKFIASQKLSLKKQHEVRFARLESTRQINESLFFRNLVRVSDVIVSDGRLLQRYS